MVILLLWKALEQKSWRFLIGILILLLASAGLSRGLTAFYEQRSGMDIGSGDAQDPCGSPWECRRENGRKAGINEFNYNTFLETGCDAEESDAIARASIADSLERFKNDPVYALNFIIKRRFPSGTSPPVRPLWVNQFHRGEFSRIVQSIYDGKLYTVLEEYMNLFQSLVYAVVLYALWRCRKDWTMEQLFLPLVILGGFSFHTLWEAKSQYIFPYFVCACFPGRRPDSGGQERIFSVWPNGRRK